MTEDGHLGAAISLARFQAILEAYGAASDRWPAAERHQALDLAAESETARRMLDEAARLDAVLAVPAAPLPSAGLVEALGAVPLPNAAQRRIGSRVRRILGGVAMPRLSLRAAAFAAVAIVAFAAGLGTPSPFRQPADTVGADVPTVDVGSIADTGDEAAAVTLSVIGDAAGAVVGLVDTATGGTGANGAVDEETEGTAATDLVASLSLI